MIDVVLPELPERPLDLTPDDVAVRDLEPPDSAGVEPPDQVQMTGRVSLGGPLAVAVTEEYVSGDPELAAFVAAEAAHTVYYMVHAAVTLRAGPDEPPFDSASVRVRLAADGAAARPTVWSMRPQRIAHAAQVTTSWRLGPELSLFEVGGTLGGVDRTRTETREEVFLEGLGELGSDPEWLLHRTSTSPLRGSYRLVMVVRVPRGATAEAAVTVRARVRARRLLWYRNRDLPPVAISAEFR